jgi:hypothetical protein
MCSVTITAIDLHAWGTGTLRHFEPWKLDKGYEGWHCTSNFACTQGGANIKVSNSRDNPSLCVANVFDMF